MAANTDWRVIENLINNAVSDYDFSTDFMHSEIIEGKTRKQSSVVKDIQLKTNGVPKVVMVIIKELAMNLMERQDNKIDELENKLKDKDERIDNLERELRETQYALDANSQYNRRDNIKICGIEVKPDEDTNDIVRKVAEFIGEPIEPSDISVSHRLPARKTENDTASAAPTESTIKHPTIICKFTRRETRNRVIRAKKQLTVRQNCPYPDAFICEDVTPLRSRIMYQLRNREDKKKFQNVWSIDGRIYCRTPEQAKQAAEARQRKQTEPKATVVNNPSDLLKLGWSREEVTAIMKIKRS